jgi:archaellum biogenesis ATPase FlaH
MPFYETENSVREILSKNRIVSLDVAKQEEKSLIIVDSLSGYFDHDTAKSIWKNIKERIKYAEKLGKKGISMLGDVGAFLFKKDTNSFRI